MCWPAYVSVSDCHGFCMLSIMKKLLLIIACITLLSCGKDSTESSTGHSVHDSAVVKTDTLQVSSEKMVAVSEKLSVRKTNERFLELLQQKKYWELSSFIHPEKGVRFSMYAYVKPDKDKIFSLSDYRRYINSEVKFTFGEKDGTGELYVTSLKSYLEKWVYKRDFASAKFYENTFRGTGNSLNNLKDIYPDLPFTENYIEGSEKYGGMDWNSLRLVFEEFNGRYYVVAVINDEWTI